MIDSPTARPPGRPTAGTTLIELIVVLALLALLLGIVPVAVLAGRGRGEGTDPAQKARETAIRSGRAVAIVDTASGPVLFLPDGRAVGKGFDPMTGERLHAPE